MASRLLTPSIFIGIHLSRIGFENPPNFRISSPASSNSFNAFLTEDLHFPVFCDNSSIGNTAYTLSYSSAQLFFRDILARSYNSI